MDNTDIDTGVRTRKKPQVSWAQVFSQGGMIDGNDARGRPAETPTKSKRGGKRGEKRRRASEPMPAASAATAATAPSGRSSRGGRAKRGRGGPAGATRAVPVKRPRSRQSTANDITSTTPEQEEPEPVIYTLAPYVKVNFMTSFLDLADLFVRFLGLMQSALNEPHAWADEVSQVPAAGKKMDMAAVEQLMAMATDNGFERREKTLPLERG